MACDVQLNKIINQNNMIFKWQLRFGKMSFTHTHMQAHTYFLNPIIPLLHLDILSTSLWIKRYIIHIGMDTLYLIHFSWISILKSPCIWWEPRFQIIVRSTELWNLLKDNLLSNTMHGYQWSRLPKLQFYYSLCNAIVW